MTSPDADPSGTLARGVALVEQGRPADALAILDRIVIAHADDMEMHNTRGRALLALGRVAEALDVFIHARGMAPGHVAPALNEAVALEALDRREEAIARYDAVIARRPDLRMAHRRRALALARLGRTAEAFQGLQHVLATWPDDMDALIDRGDLQYQQEQYTAALGSYAQAAAMAPDNATAQHCRGKALQALNRHADAVAAFDEALRIAPGTVSALINRANSLRHLVRHPEALEDYRRVLASDPANAIALANLGKTYGEIGQRAPGLAALDAAIAIAPDLAEPRWMRVTTTLPLIRATDDELPALRAEFATALRDYDRWASAAGDLPAVVNVGRPHPFYLAYQDADNRDLMAQYGAHCARVMGTWLANAGLSPVSPRPVSDGPLRVGIVSAHVLSHSVWLAIMRSWLQYADPTRVRYHVFHVGADRDRQTDLAAQLAYRFEHGVRGLRDWVTTIRAAELDALVYPEVGMDDTVIKLASMRLAPVQVVAWGHPETTGLPTIDHYVSAAALEPPGAQAHYTENLVPLPGLGCCYTPLPIQAVAPDLPALGLRADAPILICPGVPFKYTPEHDHVFAAIARRAGDCQFVFFRQDRNPLLSDAVFARLTAAFAAAGLDFSDFVRPIPWQSHARFYGLMQQADLFLDTIGFSGFNTAIQAIECGLPVVTMEGRFMRGRLASGILREMNLPELVAANPDAYVETAVRLITDPAARQAMRARIAQVRPRLFGDTGAVRAFEDFLHAACRPVA